MEKFIQLRVHIALAILLTCAAVGCAPSKPMTLMPSPVIYRQADVDPFAHLTPEQKKNSVEVFFVTNRKPKPSATERVYGNEIDATLHLGRATVHMGSPGSDWQELYKASVSDSTSEPLIVTVGEIVELADMPQTAAPFYEILSPEVQGFWDAVNDELSKAADKEIMLYVNGTKVDFFNSVILTAEIDHFAGRDFVGFAYAWPSHQNILYYLAGIDVERARASSLPLQQLIYLLSTHTVAERINILCYSAGGKVASRALSELRRTFSSLDSRELAEKFRIGSVVFAAADVEVDAFVERLNDISQIANQVVVTVSDKDDALKAAREFMGGGFRAGSLEAEKVEEAYIINHNLTNVEIIDVSYHKEIRGFDIEGHHYWYRHPWMSSDIVFLMRTGLAPASRGLSFAELEGIWYLSEDYPEKVRNAAKKKLSGQWND